VIITDENLHGALVKALVESGYEVKPVASVNYGVTDEVVISMAYEESAILVTEDKDFGELVFAHQMAKVTVVFLRYRQVELPVIKQNLLRVILEYAHLEGRFFIVVTSTKIRVRTI
jgi:predicted nuclease of predicted toxin-antitoxin system